MSQGAVSIRGQPLYQCGKSAGIKTLFIILIEMEPPIRILKCKAKFPERFAWAEVQGKDTR